ncbi:TetR/AcrR family transcriptional regulator [Streptomyces sp. G-G2]|uniref:TetR/AcrR family transcriptional regulator n=1 Tax=Streptomyces sp. G-G2 TaxID=3046201 RepID=UPI0024BBD4A0|nr:TetR/AcrR family transcriptional regulator [Streptomyces sp. G-G2]MDJ0381367.1 TetR/AcrR family transcriptional regulator [Streptomyces sp. G-G2]
MLTPKSSDPARPTPQRLLDAAETLMRTTGLANATTKAIAREAGCSEAALYKHFANKEELFVRVLLERTPNAAALMTALTADPGELPVEDRLAAIAGHAARFYADTMPIAGSLFAEPALLSRHRAGLKEIGKGPHVVLDALVASLSQDREQGRIRADADPVAAAALLLGACFQRAFFLHFSGPDAVQPVAEFAPAVARTVWAAIR